jgi:hypothetical protein
MNRRAFLIGNVSALFFLAGCLGSSPSGSEDSPTSSPPRSTPTQHPTEPPPSQQAHRDACHGANSLSFYGLQRGIADRLWSPRTVCVACHLGADADVRFVVLEENTVLGMTYIAAAGDVSYDGKQIPLDTTLSGTHTIRVVMYPAIADSGQFNATKATPCHHRGTVIQTEPTTIDFSRFSQNPSPTP